MGFLRRQRIDHLNAKGAGQKCFGEGRRPDIHLSRVRVGELDAASVLSIGSGTVPAPIRGIDDQGVLRVGLQLQDDACCAALLEIDAYAGRIAGDVPTTVAAEGEFRGDRFTACFDGKFDGFDPWGGHKRQRREDRGRIKARKRGAQ